MDVERSVTLTLFLVLSVTLLCTGQDIVCQHACMVGYTCAMVRNGTGLPEAGCITMQEALLLAQALEGGPTGPGTGTGDQSVPNPGTHSHQTAQGTITHSHEFPVQTEQMNPNPFDVIRSPGRQEPASPLFPQGLGAGFPGLGRSPNWMRPGSFIPFSDFTPVPGQRPFFQPGRQPFGPLVPVLPQRTFPGGQIGQFGNSLMEPVRQQPIRTPPRQFSLGQQPIRTPPRQFSPGQQPIRTPPRQFPSVQQPPPRRLPPRNTQFTVFDTHAQCRPCFYHYDCLDQEFCGMSDRCSGSLVCLAA